MGITSEKKESFTKLIVEETVKKLNESTSKQELDELDRLLADKPIPFIYNPPIEEVVANIQLIDYKIQLTDLGKEMDKLIKLRTKLIENTELTLS